MKRKVVFLTILIVIIVISLVVYNKEFSSTEKNSNFLMIMYTDKNLNTTYSRYNLTSKKIEDLYVRKNYDYSDADLNIKNNILYFSGKVNDRISSLHEVNLNKKSPDIKNLILDNASDVQNFRIYNNKIFFRAIIKRHNNFTIGTYDLNTKNINLWNKDDTDSTIYDFCYNQFNNKVYAIESSTNEMNSVNVPTYKVDQYNENGTDKKELLSKKQSINYISVNKEGTKALIAAASDNLGNKIYLVDLKTLSEEKLLESDFSPKKEKYYTYKNPIFSQDDNGFYYLGTTPESETMEDVDGSKIKCNEIYYYDLSTKKSSKIFEVKNKFINSFKIIN